MEKINFEDAKFEELVKHPNGDAMYAVGVLIERSGNSLAHNIPNNGTRGDYPDTGKDPEPRAEKIQELEFG